MANLDAIDGFVNLAGDDSFTKYGVAFKKGTYEELLTTPEPKPLITKNWSDQNGTKRLIPAQRFFESITYSIPIYHTGANEAEFYSNYASFQAFIMYAGYFNFDALEMNRRFRLLYMGMPDFKTLTVIRGGDRVWCESVVTLVNDYPTIHIPVPAPGSKLDQTITFTTLPSGKQVGDADFTPIASASSGLAVIFTSSNTGVATIVNGQIHIVGAGTTSITANQAGNSEYNAAASVSRSLTIITAPVASGLPYSLPIIL